MGNLIRLTENELHTIIDNSVRRILKEAMSDREYMHRAGEHSRKTNLAKGEDPEATSKTNMWDNYVDKKRKRELKSKGEKESFDEHMFDVYAKGLRGEKYDGKTRLTKNSKYGENYGKEDEN